MQTRWKRSDWCWCHTARASRGQRRHRRQRRRRRRLPSTKRRTSWKRTVYDAVTGRRSLTPTPSKTTGSTKWLCSTLETDRPSESTLNESTFKLAVEFLLKAQKVNSFGLAKVNGLISNFSNSPNCIAIIWCQWWAAYSRVKRSKGEGTSVDTCRYLLSVSFSSKYKWRVYLFIIVWIKMWLDNQMSPPFLYSLLLNQN